MSARASRMWDCDSDRVALARFCFSSRPTALRSGSMACGAWPALTSSSPSQLPEEGIVRPLADERVDLADRLRAIARAVAGDGARVARGQAGVAGGIAVERRLQRQDMAVELGPHHVVPELQLGGILGIGVGACLHPVAQLVDAGRRHRMAAHERVDVLGRPELLLGETLEGREHAAPRLPGGLEEAQAGLVGRRFLGPALAQKRAHQDVAAAHGQAAAGTGRPRVPCRRRPRRRPPSGRCRGWSAAGSWWHRGRSGRAGPPCGRR